MSKVRQQCFCHTGIESPALFHFPTKTSYSYTVTRNPLLPSLADVGVSHKPSGSPSVVLLSQVFFFLISLLVLNELMTLQISAQLQSAVQTAVIGSMSQNAYFI